MNQIQNKHPSTPPLTKTFRSSHHMETTTILLIRDNRKVVHILNILLKYLYSSFNVETNIK